MNSRIDFQEKVEQIIDAIDGMRGRELPVPGKHLLCLLYGKLGESAHEVGKQLEHNFKHRYLNKNTYHIAHMNCFCSEQLDALLKSVREAVAHGHVPRTNICYIPILFLVEDRTCRELPVFIEKLLKYFQQEGYFQCSIDLYGLIDFSKTDCSLNWKELCPNIHEMVHNQIDDLYFCSKNGMALNHVFSQATDAIEMNIFMKTALLDGSFRDFWKVNLNQQEQVQPYECNWKCISYWKMDILVCTVCQYIIEIIDFQISGSRETAYISDIRQKIHDFFYYELESRGLENLCLSIPVPFQPLKDLVDSSASCSWWRGVFQRPGILKSSGYTYGEIIRKLHGDDSFFEEFAKEVVELDCEKIDQLKETLLGIGTFRDIREQLQPIVRQLLKEAQKEMKTVETELDTLKGVQLDVRIKDVEGFLKSENQQLILLYCRRYQTRERYKVLERLDSIFETRDFSNEVNQELARQEDWKRILNAIITSNLPKNATEIKDKMKQADFYNHDRDNSLCWKDDIFEILRKDDVFKQMIREIRENVANFIKTEHRDIITIFKNGINEIDREANVQGSHAADGFYTLKGVSYSLDANRKACLLANEDFLNLRTTREGDVLNLNPNRLITHSCEASYPFTLEFFALNESVNTAGIQGLHQEEV